MDGHEMLSPSRDDAPEALFGYRRRMHDYRLAPASSALLVVDLQYGSASPDHGFAKVFRAIGYDDVVDAYAARIQDIVVPNVQNLLNTCRSTGTPVFFLTVGSLSGDYSDLTPRLQRAVDHWRQKGLEPPYARAGTIEMEVLDPIRPHEGESVIRKAGASAFTSSPLQQMLWNKAIRELIFVGVGTNYCVESTLRDASDLGYDCVLVEDGCADITPALHTQGINSSSRFARISSASAVVEELLAS